MLENWELFPNTYNELFPYLIDLPEKELVDVYTELYFEIVKLLLQDSCVDPSAYNNYAIRRASENGHTKIVKLLIKNNCKLLIISKLFI